MIADIAEKVYAGERLALDDARRLYAHHNLAELGMLAHWVRLQKHPEQVVTYNVGRNINYTNVCWVKCDFCAFYRPPGSSEGYVLPMSRYLPRSTSWWPLAATSLSHAKS